MRLIPRDSAPKTPNAERVPPEGLCKLPVFRPVAVQLLSELAREDTDVNKVKDLLNSDPAFSAEVLTLANSSLYARQSRINTVHRAIVVLGLDRTRALAATVALHGMVGGVQAKGAVADSWRHSRAAGVSAERLAPFYSLQPEQAYTAALMHDIGRLGMLSAYPEYPVLLANTQGSTEDLLEEERQTLSVDHCEAGKWLTKLWGLPDEFGATTANHHGPVTGTVGDRTDLVRLACLFAQAFGFKAAPLIDCPSPEALIKLIPEGVYPRSRFSLEELAERLQRELEPEMVPGK